MAYITPIYLVNDDVDAYSLDIIDESSYRKVFANEISVSQGEFYKAQSVEINVDLKIEIRRFEYKKQQYFIYDNELYKVVRSYKNGSKYELVCTNENIRIDLNG